MLQPVNGTPRDAVSQRQQELFIRKSTRVAASYLRRVRELTDTPETMQPFFEILERIYVNLEDVPRPDGVKTVGTFCLMAPGELIYAAGAMPVRLCSGSYTAYSIGDELVPRDACPLVKAVMGFGQIGVSPLYQGCSLMVIPITCDCKKKLAGMLDRIKPTVPLHVPPSKAEDADAEQYFSGEDFLKQWLITRQTGTRHSSPDSCRRHNSGMPGSSAG